MIRALGKSRWRKSRNQSLPDRLCVQVVSTEDPSPWTATILQLIPVSSRAVRCNGEIAFRSHSISASRGSCRVRMGGPAYACSRLCLVPLVGSLKIWGTRPVGAYWRPFDSKFLRAQINRGPKGDIKIVRPKSIVDINLPHVEEAGEMIHTVNAPIATDTKFRIDRCPRRIDKRMKISTTKGMSSSPARSIFSSEPRSTSFIDGLALCWFLMLESLLVIRKTLEVWID